MLMPELPHVSDFYIPGSRIPTDWNEHYARNGEINIALRQMGYVLTPEGIPHIDWDVAEYEACRAVGLRDDSTIVDVGCGKPNRLELWHLLGHTGGKIGIEPNVTQFDGRPYWQLQGGKPLLIDTSGRVIGSDKPILTPYDEDRNIFLIQGDANFMPFIQPGTIDLISFMFSFYHVDPSKQEPAIDLARELLAKMGGARTAEGVVDGIFSLATSGRHNKEKAREDELRIAHLLTRLLKTHVQPPEPLNSGFTSEKAKQLLSRKFRHLYCLEHKTNMVVIDDFSQGVYLRSHMSLRDKYRYKDLKGNDCYPSEGLFSSVVDMIVGGQIRDAVEDKLPFLDTISQSLFLASDRELKNLPPGFIEIRRPANWMLRQLTN